MKKLFLFVAAAAAFAACSETEVLDQTANQQAIESQGGVKFDVYTQRGITRGGGQLGDLNNKNIGKNGFGVFAYYTAGEQYDTKATPNFMYNQQVTLADPTKEAVVGSKWVYEPVKYWPNEYGNAAISDEVDYVTFFAYAPWTDVEPTTGDIIVPDSIKSADSIAVWQKKNIISVNKNTATGDPLVKYVVDTDPGTSVDLLWGVAAENADKVYSAIDSAGQNKGVKVEAGLPFIDLVKPNNPQSDRLMFNLKHALAKVKVTIDYIADDFTPIEGPLKEKPDTIDSLTTRIFVRSFKMSGFATQGALNLNNTEPGQPLWKDFDGVKDLTFEDVTFFDGRKDGKEGEVNGAQKSETPVGLNPTLLQKFAKLDDNGKYTDEQNFGVKYKPELLFGGDSINNDGFFYVIPRNEQGSTVDVTIAYDVETIDPKLAGKLSDNETHGSSIENVISKYDIFDGLDFMAGYQYEIHIHIGMTSVKMEATVTDWKDTGVTNVELPDNQEPFGDTYWTIGSDNNTIYTSDPTTFTLSSDRLFIVDSEQTYNAAYNAGPLKDYAGPGTEGHDQNYLDLFGTKHNPAGGFGLPYIVLNTKFGTQNFKGTLTINYNGIHIWSGQRDGTKSYLLMDGPDLIKAGTNVTATNMLTWDEEQNFWVKGENYAPIDPSKFEIILEWDSELVKEHSYTTPNP